MPTQTTATGVCEAASADFGASEFMVHSLAIVLALTGGGFEMQMSS
jgi:hypothetical protein